MTKSQSSRIILAGIARATCDNQNPQLDGNVQAKEPENQAGDVQMHPSHRSEDPTGRVGKESDIGQLRREGMLVY